MNINKNIKTLELDKVLQLLAKQAGCKDTYEKALNIRPFGDYYEVKRELTKTSDAYMLLQRFGAPSIGGVENPTNMVKRAEAGGVLSMRELLSVAEVLRSLRSVCDWHKKCGGIETALDYLFENIVTNKALEERITTAILSEDEMADRASPELFDIRKKIKLSQLKVREQLEKMIRSQTYQKFLQEAIVTIRDGRFVVPVKAEHKNEIKGLVHDTSGSGATIFIEPLGVVEANNDIKVLEAKEQDEIYRILAELSSDCAAFAGACVNGYDCLIDIDLYFSKARLASDMHATSPQLSQTGETELIKARHPLIDPKKVVPTDIVLGKDFDTLVVTGPNTGGKTVTLKTLGLFTLMAMCGLMLPCAFGSTVNVFGKVLVDIGDEQSIEQSLSTFSAHMTNIVSILKEADDNSLVLLDELGAGTDPVEGAALAIAILDELKMKGCKIAATTHYAELKVYALETNGVENGCCEFDVATLKPTYKLLIGVPGRSNAFAISQRLGMGEEIIERAKSIVSNENSRFEDVVSELEKTRASLEAEKETAYEQRVQAQRANSEIQEFKKKLEQQKEREIEKARNDAKRLVEKVKYEAQQIIDELTEIKKQKDSEEFSKLVGGARVDASAKLKKLENTADPVLKKANDDYVLPRALKVGDRVMLVDVEQEGVVVKLADASGMVTVEAGRLKTKTPISNIRLAEGKPKTAKNKNIPSTRTVRSKATANVSTEVDLRGLTLEEALMDLDRFIDDCVMLNVELITIIHGKGTGVLRQGVHAHLKTHRNIKSFRLGLYGEGESGVTIATLK